jgi:hypothetical protein
MSILFDDFKSWKEYCLSTGKPLFKPVIDYEVTQIGGLAATPTGQAIARRVLISDIEMLPDPDVA